jgi:DNA-binding NarL/FixJ family response regulator
VGSSAVQIYERLPRARPDVVVVDIGLSPVIEPARRGRAVLLLPASPADDLLKAAVSGGFRGFVAWDAAIDEVLRAINAVCARRAYVDAVVADWLLRTATSKRHENGSQGITGDISLTERENVVLGFLIDGMSNSEIAGKMSIAVRTVKYHVSHLLDKLGARDRAHAVALAYQAGYSTHTCEPRRELSRVVPSGRSSP